MGNLYLRQNGAVADSYNYTKVPILLVVHAVRKPLMSRGLAFVTSGISERVQMDILLPFVLYKQETES